MEDVFEKCTELALKYGRNMEYRDPYGCDLYIVYKEIPMLAVPRRSIHVYLGGREVYGYDKYTGDVYYHSGNWEKLVNELYNREEQGKDLMHRYNKILVKTCKKEAEKNSTTLGRYVLGCGAIAKDQGVLSRTSYGTARHTFTANAGRHNLKISLNRDSGYHLFVWCDEVNVFSYVWGKGKFPNGRYVSGCWEDIVYNIASEILSSAS